ncbi:hypothetical protein QBC37DRAFT_430581 [Rhypophila decipiens]|uniref:Uncharacterized protein n=1 Tax=Rhypophila decipiens TaxID=261697 RepID=A0AAN6XZ52_9PEZI|nr:hypothetical protein QBC37DRAFT_430581 [Rhypophila decipiens]
MASINDNTSPADDEISRDDRTFIIEEEDSSRPSIARPEVNYAFVIADEVWVCLPGEQKQGPYLIEQRNHEKVGPGLYRKSYTLSDESGNSVLGGQAIEEEHLKRI